MSESVSVRILDRGFDIGCPPGERQALEEAARLLDARMQTIRGEHRMATFDRVAVIAALNLAAEVNNFRRAIEGRDQELQRGIDELNRKVEALIDAHSGYTRPASSAVPDRLR